MPTSLVSTGLKFPDNTVQTTAAVAGGGNIEAVASGSLSDGSKVVINADGTVSVVAETVVTQSIGSPVTYEAADTGVLSIVYASSSGKIVITYEDEGNSEYGTAVVGTVSGTSISFGTPVVFESARTAEISSSYDSVNDKVVVSYSDQGNSSYGTAIVGTVSGTSISFGTATVFESANTFFISNSYDIAAQKTLIAYTDGGNSNYGTAVVGTVSGTSISFGTPVVFQSATSSYPNTVYDPDEEKCVVFYNSSVGRAVVATVSGTSVSFGSSVVFHNLSVFYIKSTYDSASKKVIVVDSLGSNAHVYATVGTVSGTSVSFGSPVLVNANNSAYNATVYDPIANKTLIVFYQSSSDTKYVLGTVSGSSISFTSPATFVSTIADFISATYDTAQQRVVTAYTDRTDTYGKSIVVRNAASITNLTAENYIGISNGVYTNGQTATVQVAGAVNDAQTGLTAGQAYYVQPDGTLSTTPGTPEVFAGTAVSSTKLIVKG